MIGVALRHLSRKLLFLNILNSPPIGHNFVDVAGLPKTDIIASTLSQNFDLSLGALVTIAAGVLNYYVWSYVTLWVGTNLFDGTADAGEMLRVLGYAHTPQLLGLLSFIPCVGWVFSLAGLVLSLIAAVIAIRQGLDFDTGKAVITAIIGWVIITIINVVIGLVLGVGAAGLGAIRSQLG